MEGFYVQDKIWTNLLPCIGLFLVLLSLGQLFFLPILIYDSDSFSVGVIKCSGKFDSVKIFVSFCVHWHVLLRNFIAI